MEVWLRTNTRALLFGMLPALLGLVGVVLLVGVTSQPPTWLRVIGGVMVAFAAFIIGNLAWQMRRPRMAYQDGKLLLWLRSGEPFRVPVGVVECFLLGQAPSMLPGKKHHAMDTAALVLRIAQRAEEWQHQETKSQLGKWCEGYVTIRGTWCEPLSLKLVNELNQRLHDVTQAEAAK